MAKYKAKFDHKPLSWKLFYLTVFLVLIIVFFGYFSRYLVDFLDSVDRVADNQSAVEFSQSLSEIHGKWLGSKNSIITLQLIESLDLKSKGELSFIVNEFGWPIALYNNKKNNSAKVADVMLLDCKALWLGMQSQVKLKTLRVKIMFDKKNVAIGCIYFRGKDKLFDYNLINGVINIAVKPQ